MIALGTAAEQTVTEGSRTDLLAPADLMAEVFDVDRQRFEAHRTVVDRLVR